MGSFAGIYPVQTFSSVKSSFFHPVLRRATILRHCQHPTKEISPSTLYTKTHFFDGGLKTIPWARRALPLPLLPLRRDLCVRDCLVCRHRKYSKKRIWNYTSTQCLTLTRIHNPELRREPVLDSVSSSFLDSGAAVCAGSAATCEYGLVRERCVCVCVCVCDIYVFMHFLFVLVSVHVYAYICVYVYGFSPATNIRAYL